MAKKKVVYKEPADYIPDEIQKEFKVGRYYEPPKKEDTDKRDLNSDFRDFVNGKEINRG